MSNHKDLQKLSAPGLLISLGIIYGSIGTSPLYVFKAITGKNQISKTLVPGGVSLIFCTLALQTTLTLRGFNRLLIKNALGLYRFFKMFIYVQLKKISLSEERNFGLDLSFVTVEKVPLMFTSPIVLKLTGGMCHHNKTNGPGCSNQALLQDNN